MALLGLSLLSMSTSFTLASKNKKTKGKFIHSLLVVHLTLCAGTIGANCQHRFILSVMRWAQVEDECSTI